MKYMTLLLLIIPWSIRAQNNVGIGTTAPLSKLHVVGNSTIPLPQLRLTETESDYARIKMESSFHPGTFWDIAGRSDTVTNSSKLNFYFKNNLTNGDRLTITGIGNVGISNISPEAKLDILGGDWNLNAGSPGDLRIGNPTNNFRLGVETTGGTAGTVRMNAKAGMFFGTNNTTQLAITTAGNVGIGITNPGNRLRVIGLSSTPLAVLSVSSTYVGMTDAVGLEVYSTPAAGYGVGGFFRGGYRGIQAVGDGAGATSEACGIEAVGQGSGGMRIGIRAQATGGTTNWAGYFAQGNVYVTNELRIGSDAQSGVPGYKVAIDGKIIAEELRVQLSADWPDYVFGPEYNLMPLSDLERCIRRDHHLPGIPNAAEVAENGLLVGDMQARMMEKIEELTLYIIDLEKQNKEMEQRIARLESNPKYDPR